MGFTAPAALRPGRASLRPVLRHVIGTATGVTLAAVLQAPFAHAAPAEQPPAPEPLIVGNDRGGAVRDRLRQMRQLRQSGRPVEIRGDFCFSTCTMLLGLPQTCISPRTLFGFHGPSLRGRPLPPAQFEFYSQVIAQYYPETLRRWYMETGRNRLLRIYRIRGARIIRMGVPACS